VRLEAEVDERSRLLCGVTQLRIEEDAETPILPVGVFVQASIRGALVESAIRLPRSAMRDDNKVLVVDAQNRLHFRKISLLRLEYDGILVSKGLDAGVNKTKVASDIKSKVDAIDAFPAETEQPVTAEVTIIATVLQTAVSGKA
jgi:hypothetical protein